MIRDKIDFYIQKKRCTLLGVGPMSKNCVDAVIELSNDFMVPIILIASRRQIDAAEFGSGYCNNWSTETFAEYVIDKDKQGQTILARDHGGPWQNTKEREKKLSLRKAMDYAKKSYETDIISGFEILHIDPSLSIFGAPTVDEVLQRAFELMEFCYEVAARENKKILIEIGTEEQNEGANTIDEMEYVLSETKKYCTKHKLASPTFFVVQTGTKVAEMRNIGTFDSPFRIAYELPAEIQIPQMVELCNKYDTYMKEHNTDYLSNESLAWHPKFGIHAANVAPEFGVVETKALIKILEQHKLQALADSFLEISYASQKWAKWILPNTKASVRDKAIIAGHYVFSDERVRDLKKKATAKLKRKDINLELYLKEEVKKAIRRYLYCFRLSNSI